MSILRCRLCAANGITTSAESTGEPIPERGVAICGQCGARFPIRDGVLDLSRPGDSRLLTLAGKSNDWPFVPWAYEHVWRPRSLSILSGQEFPVEREINLLTDWLAVQPGELIVDLGSSTDLYARAVGRRNPEATVVAIDMARGMLKAGRAHARRTGVGNIAHVRAPVQRLPLADASVPALVCGGSLNEFRSSREALREAGRVVSQNGRLFAMNLLRANSPVGRLGQAMARLSGISFPSPDELDAQIESAGWTCERHEVYGVVAFTLLKPGSRQRIE